MTPWIVILRKAAEDYSYYISKHAHIRMGERDISEEDVNGCARDGKVLEVQEHGTHVKALLHAVDRKGKDFYLVVALSYPHPVIVTACRFRDGVWDDLGSSKKRS